MAAPPSGTGERLEHRDQLAAWIELGEKPAGDWRIGTEHEKFVFDRADLHSVAYDGPAGIRALLDGLAERHGWQRVLEGDNVIALQRDGASVSLEPGGQFELSGAPLETVHATCAELEQHLDECRDVGGGLGLGMLGLGFQPLWPRSEVPWMPKGRYRIMRRYMPLKGTLGLDMMLRTCTVQVNLDFADEADMVRKLRVSLALQPLATAMFANSPFSEGAPNGFRSYRSHIWTDTDPDRTGLPAFVFEDGMGYERWVDQVLDTPMYFVYRDGAYIDVAGSSFREFMQGRLEALPGELPTMSDWSDHVTTLFPEVRVKRYLEMRGADGGPADMLCALPALWVGLLYDGGALDAAWDLVRDWTIEEMTRLRADVPRLGLAAPFRTGTLADVARQVVEIARQGLEARARSDRAGRSEAHFLDPLQRIAQSGQSLADRLLADYAGRWNGTVEPVFTELAY